MSDLTLKQVVAWANANNRVVVDSGYLSKLTKRASDAEEAVRLRDVNDNGLFMEAYRATARARVAEQRNTKLENSLRKIERKTHIPLPPGTKPSGWYSVIADINDHARAALRDEERPEVANERRTSK